MKSLQNAVIKKAEPSISTVWLICLIMMLLVWSQTLWAKSTKRGIAYDLASQADISVLSPGVSWWYNWSVQPNAAIADVDASSLYGMDFVPMIWGTDFNATEVTIYLLAHPNIHYLLVLNEPNLVDQTNVTPQQAAELWPRYESIAQATGVKLVGPAMNWGTMSGYNDPLSWMNAFFAAYASAHGGRDPQVDYFALHWYDYGLEDQLNSLSVYGRPFWVTEFANWHTGDGDLEVDSVAKQKARMAEMVELLEGREDVFRYAWFTGRMDHDVHHSSLLGADGQLTELGQYYLSLPSQ